MNKTQHLKDPGSAITHFIGMLMAICGAIPLLIKAAHEPGRVSLISLAVYAISLILLYAAIGRGGDRVSCRTAGCSYHLERM